MRESRRTAKWSDGWTLEQALQRTVDPRLLVDLREAERIWIAAGRPQRFIRYHPDFCESRYRNLHQNQRRQIYYHYSRAFLVAKAELLRSCSASRLASAGRVELSWADHQPLPGSAWKSIDAGINSSKAIDRTPQKRTIFDIRVFPVLEAPDVLDRLDGVTFVEAFREFIVSDPQLVARRKRALSAGGAQVSFGFPYGPYEAVLPTSFGRVRTWPTPTGCLKASSSASRRARIADLTFEKRFACLIDLFAGGEIAVRGFGPDGREIEASRTLWTNDRIYVDVENGALLRRVRHARDENDALSEIYAGLTLHKKSGAAATAVDGYKSEPVRKKLAMKVATSEEARAACLSWLISEMFASPTERPKPKPVRRKEAQKRWKGKLSQRAFDSVWSEAVRTTGAVAWSAGGAPRKRRSSQSPR
jgi:hypothetical protein